MHDDLVTTLKSEEFDFTTEEAELYVKLGLFIATIPGLTDKGRSTILESVVTMADILCVHIDDENEDEDGSWIRQLKKDINL